MVRTIRHQLEKYRTKSTGRPASCLPFRLGRLLPYRRGIKRRKRAKQIHHMAFSELSTVKDVLKELDSHRENDSIFLELLACKGGCINGPAKLSHISPALKRYEIIHQSELGNPRMISKILICRFCSAKTPTHKITPPRKRRPNTPWPSWAKTGPEDELN